MRNGTENMFLAVSNQEEDEFCTVKKDFFRVSLVIVPPLVPLTSVNNSCWHSPYAHLILQKESLHVFDGKCWPRCFVAK